MLNRRICKLYAIYFQPVFIFSKAEENVRISTHYKLYAMYFQPVSMFIKAKDVINC